MRSAVMQLASVMDGFAISTTLLHQRGHSFLSHGFEAVTPFREELDRQLADDGKGSGGFAIRGLSVFQPMSWYAQGRGATKHHSCRNGAVKDADFIVVLENIAYRLLDHLSVGSLIKV